MKRLWLFVLMLGIILLLATTSKYGITNILGLVLFAIGGYKLKLFNFKSK